MTILLYIAAGLFALMAGAVFFAYLRFRHTGLLLITLAYGLSAAISIYLLSWWPLIAGFVAAWILRITGAEPKP